MNRQFPISRRKLTKLAGAGALWLANPLALPNAHAQGIPKRFFVFCKPGGMYFNSWIKDGVNGLEYGKAVESLRPFQEKTMVVSNMFNNVARDKHHHMRGMSTMLTGVDPRGDTGPAGGKSLDQYIADVVKQHGALRSLEVGFKPAGKVNGETRMVYDGPGAARVVEGDPSKVFNRVFSDIKTTPGGGRSPALDRRQRVLDRVNQHTKLLRAELVGEDKIKLDKHLATVETLEARLISALENSSSGGCNVSGPNGGLSLTEEADILIDLAAQALVCGATNVGSYMISQGAGRLKYEWLPESAPYTKGMNWHGITHQLPRKTPEAVSWYVAADKWEIGLLARLLKQLDETPEDGGTMLDHTVVLLCGEIRNPDGHAHKGMTWALFGGNASTKWKYNSWVKADSNLHQLHTSIGRAYGLPWEKFGKVSGQLNKIES